MCTDAFVDFLKHFKSSSTEAVDQLQNLNLNGADDEYDMVDGADDPAPNGTQARNGQNKVKYMTMLQDVSNRMRDEIIIDLNDLESVSRPWRNEARCANVPQYEKATSDDEHNYKLIESIEKNAHHYIEIFSRAVDKCLPEPNRDIKYASRYVGQSIANQG